MIPMFACGENQVAGGKAEKNTSNCMAFYTFLKHVIVDSK